MAFKKYQKVEKVEALKIDELEIEEPNVGPEKSTLKPTLASIKKK